VEHCAECDSQNDARCAFCESGYALSETEGVQECRKKGLSGGAIAGIVIAAVVVIVLVVVLCVWFLVCKKRKLSAIA